MELIIDTRENVIKKEFESNEDVSVQQLDIGDIIFKYENEIFLLIERKSIRDFVDSIKSGRYREQKYRILSNVDKDKVIYLIEGDLNQYISVSGMATTSLDSAIINLLIRDNIKVYVSLNIEKSIEFIRNIYNKLKKKGIKYFVRNKEDMEVKYLSCLKSKKKENIDPEKCFIMQLSQIPGISINIASVIVKNYSSIYKLCMDLKENGPDTLKEIDYEISNDKKRRIGKKTSNKIYNYILNEII